MILGGLALIAMGSEEYQKAPWRAQKWFEEAELYNSGGSEQMTKDNYHEKLDRIEEWQNPAITKMVGGFFLSLFAFLIMWGGHRTRRPKEVRIRRD